jgi:hypothetical protein
MSEPRLITGYLAALSGYLPAQFVEELADGLDETYRHYLELGMAVDAAAETAIAEFGSPEVVAAAFARASPARRVARRLLMSGPVVGACWGAALITSQAWTWPVPAGARIVLGVALIIVIGLLATAALGRKYQSVDLAGKAGCIGIATFDSAMLVGVAIAVPTLVWPLILAATVSAVRVTLTVSALRPILAR